MNLSFKYKLMISMLGMSLVPLVVSSYYSLSSSKNELEKQAIEKLVSIRDEKNSSITRYLNTISSQIITFSHDKMIVDAAKDYTSAFNKLPNATSESAANLI